MNFTENKLSKVYNFDNDTVKIGELEDGITAWYYHPESMIKIGWVSDEDFDTNSIIEGDKLTD